MLQGVTGAPIPSHYDDLDGSLAEAFRLLARGAADRRSAMHTPCVASVGLDGGPQLRSMVLRGFEPALRRLRLHTDRRSGKVAEFARLPLAAFHAYDPGAKVQLRADCRVELLNTGPLADAAWSASTRAARVCYRIEPGPGTPIPSGGGYDWRAAADGAGEAEAGRASFAIVLLTIDRLEWLFLHAAGHRRAEYRWDEAGGLAARWLAP